MRCQHDAPTAASSGKSRSVASYATERRSLEHDSDQTSQCHHANKLATLQSTTNQLAATIWTILQPSQPTSCESTLRGRCQLQQQSQGGFEVEERLTRGEGKVRGGRQTYSARHLIDLAGSACWSSMIFTACFTARFTHVPAVLQGVTRFEPGLFGRLHTTCGKAPILSARVWRAGGSRGRYTRVTVRRPSRIANENGDLLDPLIH